MEKTFDFEQVGKRMPYTVPDGFFDKMEENVMEEVRGQKEEASSGPDRKKALRIALRAVVAVAAAVTLFFVVQPLWPKSYTDDFEPVELAFGQLSTDDQDFLLQIYEDDDDDDDLFY